VTYRIVLRNGWYVPQERLGKTWSDFPSIDPRLAWMGFALLSEARAAAIAGPAVFARDVVVEEG
jgi:hypothetical protein